jgi:hypothetical protein
MIHKKASAAASETDFLSSAHRFESPLYLFLMCYSQYLTGEKLKDQAEAEGVTGTTNSSDTSAPGIVNPFLTDVFVELYPRYKANALDGHCLYLFGVVARELKLQGCANCSGQRGASIGNISELLRDVVVGDIFMASVAMYPYNWSCWLEINTLIVQSNRAEAVVGHLLMPPPKGLETRAISGDHPIDNKEALLKAKFYFDARRPMSACLHVVASTSSVNGFELAFINHPMQLFFLSMCLVDLNPYAGLALDVVAMLRGDVVSAAECNSSASLASSNVASSPAIHDVAKPGVFALSPYVLVQEALALYSNRDYDGALVS